MSNLGKLLGKGSDGEVYEILDDDKYEDIMSYNEIIAYLEKDADNPILWKFKKIVSHQGPLSRNHPDYNGSSYNVRVEWENWGVTEFPQV